MENIVPNPNVPLQNGVTNGITVNFTSRNGRFCVPPAVKSRQRSTKYINIRDSSFCCNAPKLFNSLPKDIRNISNCSTDKFKLRLDNYLQSVPDFPHLPGLGKYSVAMSNSLIHMIPCYT